MKLNIINHELRQNRRGWIIGAVVVILFLAMFASLADLYINNDEIAKLLESYPPALMEAFGIDAAAFSSFEGYMSTQPFTFFVLLLGVFSAIWASTAIAKERDLQTDEYLFSLPYSRSEIFLSKAAAHLLQVTAVYVLTVAVVLPVGFSASEVGKPMAVVYLLTAGYLISLAFSGIGFTITVLLDSERAAMSLGLGVVVVSFLLNLLSGMDESISWLADLSLFQAFDHKAVAADAALTWIGTATTVMIYIAGLAIGWFLLRRQDI